MKRTSWGFSALLGLGGLLLSFQTGPNRSAQPVSLNRLRAASTPVWSYDPSERAIRPARASRSAVVPRSASTTSTTRSRAAAWRTVSSTAYAPGCGASGRTANGEWPTVGGVASNSLPMNSKWEVQESGRVFRVNDTGAAFDIYMTSCSAAVTYGRRTIHIRRVG